MGKVNLGIFGAIMFCFPIKVSLTITNNSAKAPFYRVCVCICTSFSSLGFRAIVPLFLFLKYIYIYMFLSFINIRAVAVRSDYLSAPHDINVQCLMHRFSFLNCIKSSQ